MNAFRLQCLLLGLITSWFGALAVSATHAASPIGLWKGEDATFEMFESDGKLSAKIVALSEPTTVEGKECGFMFSKAEHAQQPLHRGAYEYGSHERRTIKTWPAHKSFAENVRLEPERLFEAVRIRQKLFWWS